MLGSLSSDMEKSPVYYADVKSLFVSMNSGMQTFPVQPTTYNHDEHVSIFKCF